MMSAGAKCNKEAEKGASVGTGDPIFKKVVSEVLTGDIVLQQRPEEVREGVSGRDRCPGAGNSAEALRQQ